MVNGIERFLTSPSTIAQALLWHPSRPALFVHFGARAIDLATLTHPIRAPFYDDDGNDHEDRVKNPIQALPSISTEGETQDNAKYMKPQVLEQLSNIVKKHNVCGLVVSWPIQREGRMGDSCGKVMHVLNQMANETAIVKGKPHQSRPVCLWDGNHFTEQHAESQDKIRRLPLCASSYKEEGKQAAAVAADYLDFHWPGLSARLNTKVSLNGVKKLHMQKSQDIAGHNNGEIEDGEELLWMEEKQDKNDVSPPFEKNEHRPTTGVQQQGEIQTHEESLWITDDKSRQKVEKGDSWTELTQLPESGETRKPEETLWEITSKHPEESGEIMNCEEIMWLTAAKSQTSQPQAREPRDPGYIEKSEENLWITNTVKPQQVKRREHKEPGYIQKEEADMWLTNTESQKVQRKEPQQPCHLDISEELATMKSPPRQEESEEIWEHVLIAQDLFLPRTDSGWAARMLMDPNVVGADMAATKQKESPVWMKYHHNRTVPPVTL